MSEGEAQETEKLGEKKKRRGEGLIMHKKTQH